MLLEKRFFAQWGASGKWRHIPGLLYDCAEQSSHLMFVMFPITAYVTVSPAAYLTAQNRHFAEQQPPPPQNAAILWLFAHKLDIQNASFEMCNV